MAAGVDHTTDAYHVAYTEFGNIATYLRNTPNNLMARNTGIDSVCPVVFDLVQIGVTNATVQYIDQHLIRFGRVPLNIHAGQRT